MGKFEIRGPTQLQGEVFVSGSKNSILPILFATLLTSEPVEVRNIPNLKDVDISIQLLKKLGVKIQSSNSICLIDASFINIDCISYDLVKSIRASIWILAPLVARFGYGEICFPGGCCIGKRPVDLHIYGLKKLGANVQLRAGFIRASVGGRLHGAHIILNKISVGATVSIMSAASLADGVTIIENAARDPEIIDIANFLITLGARIIGAGSNKIIIQGVRKLGGGIYYIIPDRIEAGTFLVAAAISRGNVICRNSNPLVLQKVLVKLCEAGAKITIGSDWIRLNMCGRRPKSISLYTAPYPGFPTDMQAQFSVLNIIAKGEGIIIESIFENRFMHIPELIRMGANVSIKDNVILCKGVDSLFGTHVIAHDLRGSAGLVLAGCIAEGITIVHSINHIDRGYDSIEKKLCNIGASIQRIFYD